MYFFQKIIKNLTTLGKYKSTVSKDNATLGKDKRKSAVANKRAYSAAAINRLTSDWITGSTSADSELYRDLRTLRARSRELCINNDYARRFLKRTSTNVIGNNGIRLQLRAQDKKVGNNKTNSNNSKTKTKSSSNNFLKDKTKEVNNLILEQFALWGKRGSCTACGKLSWIDCQRLLVESVARDGEVLIRLVKGFDNDFNFALQFIETDHLDEELNEAPGNLASGNYIRMGIEFDKWNKPIAYYLLNDHPGNAFNSKSSSFSYSSKKYTRIPADEIIHAYILDRPSQSRGVPWMHSAMARMRMLGAYEEAELVAARVGASKMGFFVSQDGSSYTGVEDALGAKIMEADPGTFEQLPAGMDLRTFDPTHPTSSFADFEKSILRGIASGLDISYATLANDLENVNFSSIRHGSLEDRDSWRCLQTWVIEHFCNKVFEEWLLMAITTGKIKVPISDLGKYNTPIWRARGWAWVDPLKDNHANQIAIEQKTKTRSQIAADQGMDIEEIFAQIAFEEELARVYGLDLGNNDKSEEQTQENEDE